MKYSCSAEIQNVLCTFLSGAITEHTLFEHLCQWGICGICVREIGDFRSELII